jgi:hypothetical protein
MDGNIAIKLILKGCGKRLQSGSVQLKVRSQWVCTAEGKDQWVCTAEGKVPVGVYSLR